MEIFKKNEYDQIIGVNTKFIIGSVVSIIVLITALLSFYTIKSGYVGVLSTMGKYHKSEVNPGLNFKIPYIQSVTVFNTKSHVVNYKGAKDLPDTEDIINKPYIVVLDKNNQNIVIELSVQYQPVASEASEILTQYGKTYFYKAINPIIREVVRDVIGKYEAETIALNRTAIATKLKDTLINRYKNNHQFSILEVSLRNIRLPKLITDKINQVQVAKQEEQRLARVAQQAKKHQEIKTIEANTKLIEVTTRAKAEAEKKKIEADAKAYQILTEANAKAKANEEIAKSVTPTLIKYNQINQWNGSYPSTYMGNGFKNDVILNMR